MTRVRRLLILIYRNGFAKIREKLTIRKIQFFTFHISTAVESVLMLRWIQIHHLPNLHNFVFLDWEQFFFKVKPGAMISFARSRVCVRRWNVCRHNWVRDGAAVCFTPIYGHFLRSLVALNILKRGVLHSREIAASILYRYLKLSPLMLSIQLSSKHAHERRIVGLHVVSLFGCLAVPGGDALLMVLYSLFIGFAQPSCEAFASHSTDCNMNNWWCAKR